MSKKSFAAATTAPTESAGGGPTRPLPTPDTSWEARFGQVILQGGIAAIPKALFLYQGRLDLAAHEVWFVATILAHKWDGNLPQPSLHELARQAGLSVQWLRRIRAGLEAKSYLQVRATRHAVHGGRGPSSYDFGELFARLETEIAAHPPPGDELQEADLPTALAPLPARDTSFAARFGRTILQAGIAAIPHALFQYQGELRLSPQQIWLIAYILAHKWTAALPYPSLRKMAERTGYSEQQIHNIKDELVTAGYLIVISRRLAGGAKIRTAMTLAPYSRF